MPADFSGSCWRNGSSCASFQDCASTGIQLQNEPTTSNACSMKFASSAPLPRKKKGMGIEELNQVLCQEFHHAQSVLIVSHIRPDGDAVGSLLGLGQSLL